MGLLTYKIIKKIVIQQKSNIRCWNARASTQQWRRRRVVPKNPFFTFNNDLTIQSNNSINVSIWTIGNYTCFSPIPLLNAGFSHIHFQQKNWRASLRGQRFLKIRFKGKSFKWYKKAKGFYLRFGRSHLSVTWRDTPMRWKKLGKVKSVLWATSIQTLKRVVAAIIYWRHINIYNARGLRMSKQRISRKFGKVSVHR